ncbi:MAG: hypothetical protein A3H97_14060 [Acidobacteria bacterium RIFCSPLOWO2_02_FULL_65_29]|nr:MAG: hypothetical protein A3H97_14060 [Acidobacteria bacterium RIFCSPLOWO2_02_FULL_65_29]
MDLKRATALVLAFFALGTGSVVGAGDTALVQAAKDGDKAAVQRLLGQRVDPNSAATDGSTALHWAVHRDAADLVETLVTAGASANAVNRYGVTPLSLASTNGNLTIVNRLLAAGADPNAALPNGETILMTAARTGRPEVLKALLDKGANPNAREKSRGQTALMWAAAENNAAAIPVLLAGGADRDARTGDAAPAAPGAGSFSRAAGVAPAANLRPTFTAFLFAVQRGNTESVRTLLDGGSSVDEGLPDGTSALVLAVQNGHWELGGYLVDRGANVNAAGQGFGALHQITRIRRTNIGFMPPPSGKGNISSTDLVRKLLAKGADVNAPMARDFRDGYRNRFNRIGATPFLLAAKNVDTELMKIYLAAGANPMTANADKTTALMVAAGVDIWNPGEDGGSAPGFEPEALAAVKMLVELGHDVNAANDRGETALHGAAYRGANSIVEYLVSKGAKLDAKSAQGWTPWTIANGVFYSLFFKEQRNTAALLEKLMADRGISTAGMADDGRTCFDCGRNDRTRRDAEGNRLVQPAPDQVPPPRPQ